MRAFTLKKEEKKAENYSTSLRTIITSKKERRNCILFLHLKGGNYISEVSVAVL